MTSAGPEPGWMFDPDDVTIERYWNGTGWTEHRRSRPSAESRLSDAVSGPGSREPSGTPTDVPGGIVKDQDSEVPMRPQEAVFGNYSEHWETPEETNRPESESDFAPPPDSAASDATGGDNPDSGVGPQSQPTELQVGGWARVISPGSTSQGRIGQINSLVEDSGRVQLQIRNASRLFVFSPEQLEAVDAPPGPSTGNPTALASTPHLMGKHRPPNEDGDRPVGVAESPPADEPKAMKQLEGEGGDGETSSRPDGPERAAMPTTQSDVADRSSLGPAQDVPARQSARVADPVFAQTPQTTSSKLRVGAPARVVAGDKLFVGRVGTVASIDTSGNVGLKFRGSFGTFDFRHGDVRSVASAGGTEHDFASGPPRVHDRESTLSGQPPTTPATPLQRFWADLPRAGRISVIVVPILVTIGIVVAVSNNGSTSSGSFQAGLDSHADSGFSGYQGDRDARALQADTGLSDPAGYAKTICDLRAKGFSEQQVIGMNATGLHGERERALTDQDTLSVVASEYHYCPEYYHR